MISKKFSQSFYHFINNNTQFIFSEKEEIIKIFKDKTVQVIFSVSLYLIIWSFVVAFIDFSLATRGVVLSFKKFGVLNSFLPSILFIVINAIVKFNFIYFYTRNKIIVSLKHVFVGVIPIVGSLFFTAYLLSDKPIIAKAIKEYFLYIKKDFKWIKILKKKNK